MRGADADGRPIVIYRLGSLGDMVVALPALNLVASAFPGSRRLLLTNVPVSDKAASVDTIFGASGLIDEFIEYPTRLRSPSRILELRSTLRATGARDLVYLAANRGALNIYRDIAFFVACGFTRFHGVPSSRELREGRVDAGREERESERLARTLSRIGTADLDDPASWSLRVSEAEAERALVALGALAEAPFVAINMGGKEPSKDWGEARWAALIRSLAADLPGYGLLVAGAAVDYERADRIAALWTGPTANLCGSVTVRECAAALSRAAIFIGHDSGPLHLAAAVGVPSVGLFGNFNRPAKWHPYGSRNRIIHNMQGVEAIAVEEVSSAVRRMIRCPAA